MQSQLEQANIQQQNLQNQLDHANSEKDTLQQIIDLKVSSPIISDKTFNEQAGSTNELASFTAQYAGYVLISGKSTSDNIYFDVLNNENIDSYSFLDGSFRIVPILPGYVKIMLKIPAGLSTSSIPTTLTITYYY